MPRRQEARRWPWNERGELAKGARIAIVLVAGAAGAYVGFWIAHLAGWSGNARWPLDPQGGAGTTLMVISGAALAVLTTGFGLAVIPIFTYRKVAKEGRQTHAIILEAWRTGVTTHDLGEVLSEYGLRLEIRPASGTRYQTRTKTMVATQDEAAYRPGSHLEIRYHPTTPRKVFVVGPIPDGRETD